MTTFLQDIQDILRPGSGFANATVDYSRLQGTQLQTGGIECGVFMLGHIHATVCEVAIAFTMKDMPVMRDRILLLLTSKPETQNPQEDHTTPPVGLSASADSYPSQRSAIYDPEPDPGFCGDEPGSPTDEFDDPVLVDPVDVLFDGSRTCPTLRPWKTASVSQPPASWVSRTRVQEFWKLLRFLDARCCSLGVPVENITKEGKYEQVRLRRNRGEPIGFVGDVNLTVHTVQVGDHNEVCVQTEGEGEWHIWFARIGQYTMPVWAERGLHWLLDHVKTRPQVLSSRRVSSAVPVPASAPAFQSGSSECMQTRRLEAFLADNELTLSPEWKVDEAVTAQLQKYSVDGTCPPARYMKSLISALANEPVGVPEHAGVTVHTLSIDPDMHVVLASKGCGRRHVWLAQIGDHVTGVWRSKPGDPNAAVEAEAGLEVATMAAKVRMQDIIALTTTPYYLTQSTDIPNTPWTGHLVESKLLNAHGRNFELVKGYVSKDELDTIRELVEAIPTDNYVDWLHVNNRVRMKGLVQTLKKCVVQFEGCADQPAFHGVSEDISEAEKATRKKKVVLAVGGSRLGDLLRDLYGRFRKLIPPHMLAKIKNPDKVYLVQVNKTTAPQPHHEDERKYDGPGGCIILLYVTLAAMVVFAGYDDEGKEALFHRWIEAGDVYIFCGELRVHLDHGTYPTNGIARDGRAKSVADASESEIRTALTFRVGDNASEDETDDDDEVVVLQG